MRASIGDRVFVSADRGARARMGRIAELRHPDGTPPYVVHWYDTGIESLFFPRDDGPVWHLDTGAETADVVDLVAAARRVRAWSVELQVFEEGSDIVARAVLREDDDGLVLAAQGRAGAHEDHDVPHLGDDVAVARALSHLATLLLGSARSELAEAEHVPETQVDLSETIDVSIPAQTPERDVQAANGAASQRR
jgi:hypothetical protein